MKTVEVEVRLFATLREGRFVSKKLLGTTPKSILHLLDIPLEEAHILLRNGHAAAFEDALEEGDVLSIFPPVGGG